MMSTSRDAVIGRLKMKLIGTANIPATTGPKKNSPSETHHGVVIHNILPDIDQAPNQSTGAMKTTRREVAMTRCVDAARNRLAHA